MSDSNTLKTRIKLLYKTWAQWEEVGATFYPYKGEVCLAEIPTGSSVSTSVPIVLIKVGIWDGVEGSASHKSFAELDWIGAKACDVYSWGKKEHLEWSDITEDFKQEILTLVGGKTQNTLYRIISDSTNKWQLQKSDDKGSTWVNAEGTIDLSSTITTLENKITAEETRAKSIESTKTTQEISNANGKSLILNESDGGGVFFIKDDNTSKSFIGVNDSSSGGPDAQIYAIDPSNNNTGAKLDVLKTGIYYTVGNASYSERIKDENLLVTKKDLAGGLYYVGKTTLASGETYEQAINRLLEEKSHTPKSGAIVIIESSEGAKEFIYDGTKWQELGDEGLYATKAELSAEVSARETADTALSDRISNLELSHEPEVKTINNIVYLFANGASIRIEDNATNNIAYYATAEGVQKSIEFPYDAIVHGGGYGTINKFANYTSALVIMKSGRVKSIYGGSRGYGSVGTTTIVVNGGILTEGAIGGGAAPNAGELNTVGTANITLNGGTSLMSFGGGMGLATVGKVEMLINGGTHQWVTAGGANGTTGSANVEITGGTITCMQTVNRGIIQDATITVSGGTITNLYAGGETSDSSVTGKCEKTILHIDSAFSGHLNKGTYGGVEDASRCSGDYISGAVLDTEALACNLVVVTVTVSTDSLVPGTNVWILECNY